MSSFIRRVVPLALTSALLSACGGKSFDAAGTPQAGSDSGGSPTAGRGGGGGSGRGNHGGTSSGGTSSGGIANGGEAGADRCDPTGYEDAMGGSVPVLIINQTQKPIYLGQETLGCGNTPWFQVADASGEFLPPPNFCQVTCDMLLTNTVHGCPPIVCPIGAVTTLQPGESASSLWTALYNESIVLSAACEAKVGGAECVRIREVEPGTYYFSAQAGSGMRCEGMGPDGMASCSNCAPNGTGGCVTTGAVITPPLLRAKVEVQLDGSYGIGGPGGGGMVRAVEIVFED